MRILIANDHGGVELKQRLVGYLTSKGQEVENLGVDSTDSVDYPDIARSAAERFFSGDYGFGILICGTGIGISMSANKIPGVRCALPQNIYAATMAKEHNNANFIAFGGRIDYQESPESMLDAFMGTSFEGGRHERRVGKINALD